MKNLKYNYAIQKETFHKKLRTLNFVFNVRLKNLEYPEDFLAQVDSLNNSETVIESYSCSECNT